MRGALASILPMLLPCSGFEGHQGSRRPIRRRNQTLGNRTIVISTPRMPYMGHLGGWNTSGITELLL